MARKFNARPKREHLVGGHPQGEWIFSRGEGELWPDDKDDDRDRIAGAIEDLREPYRSVVEMRFYGRLTHSQIAKEMGWKDRRWSSVYLRRALTMLERSLRAKR